MQITKELLKEKSACADGYRWFLEKFPEGGEYQAVLDALCEDDRLDDAKWLLGKFGAMDTVFEAESIVGRKHFVFAGRIAVSGKIVVSGFLVAGSGIEAGWGIKAGEGIEAGDDFGIFAGIRIRISRWSFDAVVRAKMPPKNLISGKFEAIEEES